MLIGKVVGTVVATQKEASLDGMRLLLVRPMSPEGELGDGVVVAVDAVGAGEGEVVLYASGSSARQTEASRDRPVDATIMAIVDALDLGGEITYRK